MTVSEVVMCIKLVAQQPLSPSEDRIEGIDEIWLYLAAVAQYSESPCPENR